MSTDAGILYDPDETEHLSKKLTDLGMRFSPDCILEWSLTQSRDQIRHFLDCHR